MSDTSSQRAQRNIENFEVEKLAQKMIMLRQQHESFEGRAIVQHNEAVYMVRKHILEKAKTFFKEVKDVNINHVLGLFFTGSFLFVGALVFFFRLTLTSV